MSDLDSLVSSYGGLLRPRRKLVFTRPITGRPRKYSDEQIIAAIRALQDGDRGPTLLQVAKSSGMSDTTLTRRIVELVKSGRVQKTKHGWIVS